MARLSTSSKPWIRGASVIVSTPIGAEEKTFQRGEWNGLGEGALDDEDKEARG